MIIYASARIGKAGTIVPGPQLKGLMVKKRVDLPGIGLFDLRADETSVKTVQLV